MPPSQQGWIERMKSRLAGVSETAGLDAQVLLAHVLERSRSWVLAHPEAELSFEQAGRLEAGIIRLERGEPLPYVLGRWEFYGLEFEVGPAVLIPRPETEQIVDEGLSWLATQPGRRFAADVGTGSGCIAIALAANLADLRIRASDISADALQIAGRNVQRYGLEKRIRLVEGDLLAGVEERFDLVCANLPYIPSETLEELEVCEWEPRQALDGGPDGLGLIHRLLDQLPECMAPGGLALLEIEVGEGLAVQEAARERFREAQVSLLADLAGLDRVLKIQTC